MGGRGASSRTFIRRSNEIRDQFTQLVGTLQERTSRDRSQRLRDQIDEAEAVIGLVGTRREIDLANNENYITLGSALQGFDNTNVSAFDLEMYANGTRDFYQSQVRNTLGRNTVSEGAASSSEIRSAINNLTSMGYSYEEIAAEYNYRRQFQYTRSVKNWNRGIIQ